MHLDSPSTPSWGACSPSEATFLQALAGRNTSGLLPVWLMRQAGRALPPYRRLRERHPLSTLFENPELISQITCMPIDLLEVDAAILFADILHVLRPLGFAHRFPESGGAFVDKQAALNLNMADLTQKGLDRVEERLAFVREGIVLTRERLSHRERPIPLIGFCGGPLTVAHYVTQRESRQVAYTATAQFQELLEAITQVSIHYLKLQIEAGVEAIQIFESCSHLFSRADFKRFSLPYLQTILQALPAQIPTLIFTRHTALFIDDLIAIAPSGLSFDYGLPLEEAHRSTPSTVAVQGNVDPELLLTSPKQIEHHLRQTLTPLRSANNLIINLGHGVLPQTPVEHLRLLVETVHTL